MSQSSVRGAITYEVEAAWAEDVDTTATLRVPVLGAVDCSGLRHDKIDPDRVTQRRQEGSQWIIGTMGASSFKTRLWLTGHGSATSGATSLSATETLLSYVFGNSAVSAASGTTTTGGTASVPITAASGTFSAGSLCRIGAINDTRGNGQVVAIATHTGTSMTLLTAIDGAPNSGDVVYSAATIYPSEAPTTTTITGLRMLLQTSNLQYLCHGVYPTAVAFGGLKASEVPWLEVTWGAAWWEYKNSTFPSAVATDTFQPAANAGGSLFYNDVGTATRAKRTARDFTIDYTLGITPLRGPGGVNQYQDVVGAVRTPDAIKIGWTEDADAATLTPTLPDAGVATTAKHVLYTTSATAQKSVGIYFPNAMITNVATQFADDGINRLRVEAMAYTGTTTTNDLTSSAFRMALS